MAKEKMITRTITSTKVTATVADIANNVITEHVYTVPGKLDADTALKPLKEQAETDNIKILRIVSTETIEKLYGMSEITFIANAVELPPR